MQMPGIGNETTQADFMYAPVIRLQHIFQPDFQPLPLPPECVDASDKGVLRTHVDGARERRCYARSAHQFHTHRLITKCRSNDAREASAGRLLRNRVRFSLAMGS